MTWRGLSVGGPMAAVASDRDQLMATVYEEMKALAAHHLRRERNGHTLQATALVHEAYLRLAKQSRVDWQGRTHFLSVASEIIRRVLVDHARARLTSKRGGRWQRIPLEKAEASSELADSVDVLAVDAALEHLSKESPREARVLELRVFGGLTVEQAASALDVSPSTVDRDWRMARAWLARELARGSGKGGG